MRNIDDFRWLRPLIELGAAIRCRNGDQVNKVRVTESLHGVDRVPHAETYACCMPVLPTVVVCQACGATAGEHLPIDWVTSVERGRVQYYCAACARDNLRSIEARLDPAWW